MKILVVSNMYPSNKYPHYGVFVENTVKTLCDEGFTVDISVMKKANKKINKVMSYLWFYYITVLKILFHDYDYIYVHYVSLSSIPVLLASRIKKGLNIISNVHGNDIIPESEKDNSFILYSKRILKISSKIICPSKYFMSVLQDEYGIEEKRIVVYPSGGVDLNIFKPINKSDVRKKLGLADGKYLGYISRIEKDKGYDIFLRACYILKEKYDDLRILVVGDGDEIEIYNQLVSKLSLENEIIKYDLLSQRDIADIFNALDVFVFPTYRKSESLGLVGIEAMACGTLTILPDKYGPSSYGKDGSNCFVFKSNDINSMVNKIEQAFEYQDKERICNNARITAIDYSSVSVKKILLDCFNAK